MKVGDLVNQIERKAFTGSGRTSRLNAEDIQEMLAESLSDLSSMEDFDFLKLSLDPLIQTEPGVRSYELPENFPANFIKTTDPEWGEYVFSVKLDDGNHASPMRFERVDQFHLRDLSTEQDSRPSAYTIEHTPAGGRQITLAPPPDTTTYTVSGVYVPNEWRLDEEDQMPFVPNNFAVLRYDVLRQMDRESVFYDREYNKAVRSLMYSQAKNSPSRMRIHPRPRRMSMRRL